MTANAGIAIADTGGVRTAYRLRGTGPALLLLHGAEADMHMFDGLADSLVDAFTVIAYDQRDCGATVHTAARYTFDELAADAAALIAQLGLARVHVFGTSLGGTLAQVLAVRHPERVHRLVLGSTWRVGTSPLTYHADRGEALSRLRADPGRHATDIAAHFFSAPYLQAHPEAADRFRGTARTPEQRERRAWAQAQAPALPLDGIRAPTLVLAGACDRVVPVEASAALARAIPGAACQVLDGLAHVGAIEAPQRLADAIRSFLSQGAGGS